MDYEQKYKEALERARNIRFGDPNSATANVVCEEIFPELKESEDERIKKAIRNHIIGYDPNNEILIKEEGISEKQMLAWLEKQGEPNWAHHKVDLSDCSKEYRKAYYDGWNNCNKQHSQLKDEQNPAWSEEDEGELYLTISLLDKLKEEAYTNDCENCINWLKSLKNRVQPHWKPTEKQIYALSMAYKDSLTGSENLPTQTETLKSLYNDLKKL